MHVCCRSFAESDLSVCKSVYFDFHVDILLTMVVSNTNYMLTDSELWHMYVSPMHGDSFPTRPDDDVVCLCYFLVCFVL